MKILSWNVNGIRSISKKGFPEWFRAESPDILCLQETKAYPEQLQDKLKSPEGYYVSWNNPDRKGYAGVAVFSKEKPALVIKDFSDGSINTEGRMLALDFGDYYLLNVYFPNGRMNKERLGYKLDFYEKFLVFVDSIKNRNIIICGDINTAHKAIDLARPKQNEMFSGFLPSERAWMDKLTLHGYVDTFRHFEEGPEHYSWWDYKSRARERNVGWRIDYFFVTEKFLPKVKNAFIMPEVPGSDHCPVGIEI